MKATFGALGLLVIMCAGALAHEKDLRKLTDTMGETEISFCARPSPDKFNLPGHVFVAFSESPMGGVRNFRAVGHTIATGVKPVATLPTYFGGAPVAGKQMEERYTDIKQACLTTKVDRIVFGKALEAARPTLTALGVPDQVAASTENYSLNANDCIDFAIRVAKAVEPAGLKVPPRAAIDLPQGYIAKLIQANP